MNRRSRTTDRLERFTALVAYPFPIPTWVISIDEERYGRFQKRLGHWSESITRWPGVVGKELQRYTMCATILDCPSQLTAGEVGCWLSHWQLWKKAAEQPGPTVICEDDVNIRPTAGLAQRWLEVWTELQTLPWDVAFLGTQPRNRAVNESAKVSPSWSRPTRCCGNFLYMVSPGGATKLLRRALPIGRRPVDNFIIDLSLNDADFRVLCLVPAFGYVIRVVSTTHESSLLE